MEPRISPLGRNVAVSKPAACSTVSNELYRLFSMAGPLFLQNAASYSTLVMSVALIGHLGDPVLLSGAVLGNSIYNVTAYSLLSGLSGGMETLCGQAYGACSYKTLGLVLQRSLLICWVTCLPVSLLYAYAEPVLLVLGQKPTVAKLAASYLWRILPAVFMVGTTECLKRYLLAQRVVLPGMITTVLTCCLCPVYNWLLIYRYQLGLHGAAYAFVLSQGSSCLLLLAYTAWRDASMASSSDAAATWPRPGLSVFTGWLKYLRYGVPSAIMLCMEWWCYEVAILLAGVTHNAEVAVGVMGIMLQITSTIYMSGLALSTSANTNISNALGAGHGAAARLSFWTSAGTVVVVQAAWTLACLIWQRQVMGVMSSSGEVVELALKTLPIMAPTFISDSINCCCQAALRGAGRPGIGAALNVVAYWLVGLPVCAVLGIQYGMGVSGLWTGLLVSSCGMSVVQLLVISTLDWSQEVDRAAALMQEHEHEADELKAALLGDAAAQHSNIDTHNEHYHNHERLPHGLATDAGSQA